MQLLVFVGADPGIVMQPHQTLSVPMWIQFAGAISNTQAALPQKTLNDMTWQLIPDPSPPKNAYSGPHAANCGGTKALLPFAHLPFSQPGTGNFVTPGNAVSCVPLAQAATPAPESNPCGIVHGSIGKEMLASIECSADETVLEARCGFAITTILLPALKAAKVVAAARGASVIDKLPPATRPVGKLLYDLYHADFLKSAPPGFRTPKEVVSKLATLKTAYELMNVMPSLVQSVSGQSYGTLAADIAKVAGLKPCIDAVRLGVSK